MDRYDIEYWRNRRWWAVYFYNRTTDMQLARRLLEIAREAATFEWEARQRLLGRAS